MVMAPFTFTSLYVLCLILNGHQALSSCALFGSDTGDAGLGSTLMSVLLMQGLRSGGGFHGVGPKQGRPSDEIGQSPHPTQARTAVVAQNPLLLPLLFMGGAGRMGGLGALGLPLLLGMGGMGGLGGGLGGLAPIALLGLSGMGGLGGMGGLSALAPLALLGMSRFRPFVMRKMVLDPGDPHKLQVAGPNATMIWSPIASANRLRRHFGYGFLWGKKRATMLKRVAEEVQHDPAKLGRVSSKVWSSRRMYSTSEEHDGAMPSRATVLAGKFVRWVNKLTPVPSKHWT